MTPEETAWLAGLLEGEGSFGAYARKDWKLDLVAQLKMTDRDVVVRACRLMGADTARVKHCATRDGYSDAYQIVLHAADAARVMRAIRPYMGERRGAKIDECLAARPDLREENA